MHEKIIKILEKKYILKNNLKKRYKKLIIIIIYCTSNSGNGR